MLRIFLQVLKIFLKYLEYFRKFIKAIKFRIVCSLKYYNNFTEIKTIINYPALKTDAFFAMLSINWNAFGEGLSCNPRCSLYLPNPNPSPQADDTALSPESGEDLSSAVARLATIKSVVQGGTMHVRLQVRPKERQSNSALYPLSSKAHFPHYSLKKPLTSATLSRLPNKYHSPLSFFF